VAQIQSDLSLRANSGPLHDKQNNDTRLSYVRLLWMCDFGSWGLVVLCVEDKITQWILEMDEEGGVILARPNTLK